MSKTEFNGAKSVLYDAKHSKKATAAWRENGSCPYQKTFSSSK